MRENEKEREWQNCDGRRFVWFFLNFLFFLLLSSFYLPTFSLSRSPILAQYFFLLPTLELCYSLSSTPVFLFWACNGTKNRIEPDVRHNCIILSLSFLFSLFSGTGEHWSFLSLLVGQFQFRLFSLFECLSLPFFYSHLVSGSRLWVSASVLVFSGIFLFLSPLFGSFVAFHWHSLFLASGDSFYSFFNSFPPHPLLFFYSPTFYLQYFFSLFFLAASLSTDLQSITRQASRTVPTECVPPIFFSCFCFILFLRNKKRSKEKKPRSKSTLVEHSGTFMGRHVNLTRFLLQHKEWKKKKEREKKRKSLFGSFTKEHLRTCRARLRMQANSKALKGCYVELLSLSNFKNAFHFILPSVLCFPISIHMASSFQKQKKREKKVFSLWLRKASQTFHFLSLFFRCLFSIKVWHFHVQT